MNRTVHVETDRPERFAKQLGAHLGHRLTVTAEPSGSLVVRLNDTAYATVRPVPAGLEVESVAGDLDELERIEDVVVRHLRRFIDQARH
jgi:hypothetical protein